MKRGKMWFAALAAVTLALVVALSGCGGGSAEVPEFKMTSDRAEDGVVSLSYVIQGEYDYFSASDAANKRLAETVFDDALAYTETNYSDINSIFIVVNATNGYPAFTIDRPGSMASPKVRFQKAAEGTPGVFDYEWYDTRHGTGAAWE